jgi:hypothetical protein
MIGEVDTVGGGDHDEHEHDDRADFGQLQPVDVADERQVVAGHRHSDGALVVQREVTEARRDQDLADELAAFVESSGVLAPHLQEVVEETDQSHEHEQSE